jgi:hypothetical protein
MALDLRIENLANPIFRDYSFFAGHRMNQFRKYLIAYVSGILAFEQFWNWFSEFSIDAANQLQGDDLDLLREIALSVAEYTGGHIQDRELKADIRKYAGLGALTKS